MSNGQTTPTGADNPLTKDVSTGHDNPVQTAPFSVIHVKAGDKDKEGKWDVTKGPLSVEYRISDQNSMAKSGRIVYFVKRKAGSGTGASSIETVVYKQAVKPGEIKPGKNHTTKHWDGKISEGLTDRIGQKVTADLSPIGIRVEIWDQATAAPGKPLGGGKTDVPGEYLSTKETQVVIDVIAEAKWETHRCIPYGDPMEPQLGKTKMKIRLNVAEGTQVRIAVCRIADINDPSKDELYTRTPSDKEEKDQKEEDRQKGLIGAKVDKGGRVMVNGKDPYVEWKNYDEHWKHEGENNFYCFKLAFGKAGEYMSASERDYTKNEKDCLHMRFTVFIHRPSNDLDDYTKYARQLNAFFRKDTKYFRSYLMEGGPKSPKEWGYSFFHHYIVIILGHASCDCNHPQHPRKDGKPTGDFLDLFHSGFLPDQNCCPKEIEHTKKAEAALKADEKHYKSKFGGCGFDSHVSHFNLLGRTKKGEKVYVGNQADESKKDWLLLHSVTHDNKKVAEGYRMLLRPSRVPRLFFWNGGCRTILTTNLGERLTKNGTRYYSGWTYSPGCDYAKFCYDVFHRWIKGTKEDPAPSEFSVDLLPRAYVTEAGKANRPNFHPRLTDNNLTLSQDGPQRGGDYPIDSGKQALA